MPWERLSVLLSPFASNLATAVEMTPLMGVLFMYFFQNASGLGSGLLQPLCWRCVECAIHHERDVHEEQ